MDIDGDPFGGPHLGASAGHADPNGVQGNVPDPTYYSTTSVSDFADEIGPILDSEPARIPSQISDGVQSQPSAHYQQPAPLTPLTPYPQYPQSTQPQI